MVLTKNIFQIVAVAGAIVAAEASASPLGTEAVQRLFPETTARPLFSQTRRPVPVVAAKPEIAPVQEDAPEPTLVTATEPLPLFDGSSLRLRGTLGRSNDLIALVEHIDGTTEFRLARGETKLPGRGGALVDVEVVEVTAHRVILRADQVVTLTLRPESDDASVSVTEVTASTLMAVAQPDEVVLEPTLLPELVASHAPTGVSKTSLFTISGGN